MITAGFIKQDGSVKEVFAEHWQSAGGFEKLATLLKTTIRFRVYDKRVNNIAFETLAKKITAEQKMVIFKYLKAYPEECICCQIGKDYQEANGFLSKIAVGQLKSFINDKVK